MDERLASYLSAILNSASILGRIVPGILGDRLGRMNALCAAGVATAILILCLDRGHLGGRQHHRLRRVHRLYVRGHHLGRVGSS